jgi:hypothetical protein
MRSGFALALAGLAVVAPACRGEVSESGGSQTVAATEKRAAPEPAQPTPPAAAPPGHLRLDPSACDPVLVPFARPAGFEAVNDDEESAASFRTPPVSGDPYVLQEKRAWLDFVTVSARCGDRPDRAQRWAQNIKDVSILRQPERPFEGAADPRVAALRMHIEILTDTVSSARPVLEYRTVYPDGTPPGFIYDTYEGWCWHPKPRAGVVVVLEINSPIEREEGTRARFRRLCGALASADLRR